MGCSASRLDREEEMPVGLRPFRPRIEELKRLRRAKNASVVPTTDLRIMKPIENDDNNECNGGLLTTTSDSLGSPSFRIFFENTPSTWDSVDDDSVIQNIKNAKLAQAKKDALSNGEQSKNTHGRESSNESLASNTSGEELDTKPLKKDRARRFKAVTKAPSRAYSFLTERNRSGHSCACHAHGSPRFRTGKSS